MPRVTTQPQTKERDWFQHILAKTDSTEAEQTYHIYSCCGPLPANNYKD